MAEKKTLYIHVAHPHQVRNTNQIHKEEQEAEGFNTRIAVWLTKRVGSMWCAYLFMVLAIIGLFGLLGWLNPFTFLLATWASQQCAQLVLLPVIMVGQNTLSRHAELQAEQAFETTMKSYHDLEQITIHLDHQDAALLKIVEHIEAQQQTLQQQLVLITTLQERLQTRRYF